MKVKVIRTSVDKNDYFVIKFKKNFFSPWEFVMTDPSKFPGVRVRYTTLKFRTIEECEKYIFDNILVEKKKKEDVVREYTRKDMYFNGYERRQR